MSGHWIKKNGNSTSIVFIHGVLSSGDTAWKHNNGTNWPDLVSNDNAIDLADIYVFTYRTGIFSGTYRLGDVVDALKEYLQIDGVLDSKRIVFVCHSMGGIVARKYIVERAVELIEKDIELGLFLIASPSLGSNYANWLSPLAKLFGHSQGDALRFSQNNAWLMDLDREFINIKEAKKLSITGKELVEDRFVVLKRLIRKQVVQPFSGARYFGDPFKVPNSDHSSIAKVENENSIQHRLLVKFLQDFLVTKDADSTSSNKYHAKVISDDTKPEIPAKTIRLYDFEAIEEREAGLLKYQLYRLGNLLTYSQVIDLWIDDVEFVKFFNSIFKQCGFRGYIWESCPISKSLIDRPFEFVIHSTPASSGQPDYTTYAEYFDSESAPDGVVAFKNLGHDALLVVPSPYRREADYSGLAEFFQQAPEAQQIGLWRELGIHAKNYLSDDPLWISVAGGGIAWLHLRMDSRPKYYRYSPYRIVND